MTLPCSPRLKTHGLVYLPRLCDKIRLHMKGELPEDYHANLGGGMDLWTCQFLGVDYETLASQVRKGSSDEETLDWARENGVKREDYDAAWWSYYMLNRGFRDDLSERLVSRKEESGMSERGDILSFMDYIDADEGRS